MPNVKKTWLVAGTSIGIVGSLYTYTGVSWYSGIPKTKFHFFDDSHEWKQMDKIGHAWTAYQESKMVNELLIWAGHNRKTRGLVTALAGFCFQAPLEVFDGYTAKWGASVTDLIANASGALLAAINVWAFDKQKIQLKFSFHRTPYADQFPDLFGKGITSIFKDYNGQTYWLVGNINDFIKKDNKFPRWLNIAIGHGAQGLQGGYGKIDKKILQQTEFRQWYLAPDIQFSKLPTQNTFLKVVYFVLDAVHIPLPAIEWNKHYLRWHWIYF
ncbi:MAG: DUF2279 domain-containing protein [Bacteroidia bacterium]|nr:MAG: DUF2279 domain-containing protein [Bacteroidia bacterium]